MEGKITRAAEDKLTYRLGVAAAEKCQREIEAYNACCRGRTFSVLWACRSLYQESQDCIHKYVNKENLETMKQRWIAAGKPTHPDWNHLLDGMLEK